MESTLGECMAFVCVAFTSDGYRKFILYDIPSAHADAIGQGNIPRVGTLSPLWSSLREATYQACMPTSAVPAAVFASLRDSWQSRVLVDLIAGRPALELYSCGPPVLRRCSDFFLSVRIAENDAAFDALLVS